jgi:ornithine cyclodeaminase/alanine dehydrogenase-like protein (mu-crystallin family)
MIYLTEKNILQTVSFNDLLDAIEASMYIYENKEYHMPQRLHVDHEEGTLLLMPCFTKDYFGTKLVSLFPRNSERNIPVLTGIMVLNDGQTGRPLALLDGPALTALRTAVVASVSIRHLTLENTQSLGIVGAGVQGFYQAWVACSARDLKDIHVFDLYPEKTTALVQKLSKVIPDVNLHAASNVEDLLENSQVVITATTSFEPVLPDKEELLSGKHFIGIGSYKPDVREFPQALFNLLKTVFIDTDTALEESGDLIVPLQNNWIRQEQVMTLGRFLIEGKHKDKVKTETTLFKSVGMALFDVCASKLIYENAIQKGLGQKISP